MRLYGWPKYLRCNGTRDYIDTQADPMIVRQSYRTLRNRGMLDYQARQTLVRLFRNVG